MRYKIEIDATICSHPEPVEEDTGLICCPDCGSKFPSTGKRSLWASGIKVKMLGVTKAGV